MGEEEEEEEGDEEREALVEMRMYHID